MMNEQQRQQLRDLLLDGNQLKPAFVGKSHVEIRDLLRVEVDDVDRESIDSGMIASALVPADVATLDAGQKYLLSIYTSAGLMQLTQALKASLASLFQSGTQTRTNLIALAKRRGTIAERAGIPLLTESDIADVLREI